MDAATYFAGVIATDTATGVAILHRDGTELARTPCTLFPSSWFGIFQETGQIGDMVEVHLGAPLNRSERYYLATANHNRFVTGYCTESMWRSAETHRI